MRPDLAKTSSSPIKSRLLYLEGLRGLACLQVLFGHNLDSFLPGVVTRINQWPELWRIPAKFIVDGQVAVDIFFILSGVVLTLSFERFTGGPWLLVIKRLVRLSIPVWASLVVTILLTLGWPTQHLLVAAHNGSTWLAEKNLTTPTWQIILRAFIPIVGSTEAALINSPLWTIRYELLGSFLMILLVQLRKWHFWLHAAGCFLIYVFFFYPYATFLLGHLLALFIRTKSYATLRGIPRINILTIMMLVAGIFLCQSDFLGLAKAQYQIYAWATDWRHLEKVPIHTIQWMIAADFIAVAIICSNWMQEILERPICQKIGQLSFSIYLLHFPILLTVTSALILGLQAQLGWGLATALALLGGLSLTGVAAHFFEKYCDRRAIQLSRDFLQSEQLR